MTTFTAQLQQHRQVKLTPGENFIPSVKISINQGLALLSVITAAAAIVLLSVWVAGMEISNVIDAGIWGVGLIFLGLAVDNDEPVALLQFVTGIVLLALAWLQFSVSADYIIVSGVIVATWVAFSLFKRLR
jgi:hypothetical protein